jgi:hypothetical protein
VHLSNERVQAHFIPAIVVAVGAVVVVDLAVHHLESWCSIDFVSVLFTD